MQFFLVEAGSSDEQVRTTILELCTLLSVAREERVWKIDSVFRIFQLLPNEMFLYWRRYCQFAHTVSQRSKLSTSGKHRFRHSDLQKIKLRKILNFRNDESNFILIFSVV